MKWFPNVKEALAELPWLGEGEIIRVGPGRPGRLYRVVRVRGGLALQALSGKEAPAGDFRRDAEGRRWVRAGRGKALKK